MHLQRAPEKGKPRPEEEVTDDQAGLWQATEHNLNETGRTPSRERSYYRNQLGRVGGLRPHRRQERTHAGCPPAEGDLGVLSTQVGYEVGW